MKDRWKNNIGLKIVAVFFAVFLWWIVANVDDPIITKKYRASVTVTHPEVITNIGKSYHIVDDTQNVMITIKARRSIAEQIRTSDIQATADFREMQDSAIPVRIVINGYEGLYVEASANPQNIQVVTEDTQKKTFPIVPVTTGNVRAGYVLGEITAKPQSIDISGPKSLIGRIDKVVAKVDVSELSESTEIKKAQVIYYDSAENIIDQSQLSSNCDKKGVNVQVKILDTKELSVEFDTSEIKMASGYIFKGITVEPEQITVYGAANVLRDLHTLKIDSSALKQKKLKKNKEVVVDITPYLPEGVQMADENSGSIVVNISVEKSGTKTLLLPVRSVLVNNAPENLLLTYGPEQEVELRFQGSEENLEKLTLENVITAIDLAAYKEAGSYDVAIQIIDCPDGCTYTGGASVEIILSEQQEEAVNGE